MVVIISLGSTDLLKIAYCLPYLRHEGSTDASFIQQKLIADGLRSRGHIVKMSAPNGLSEVVWSEDLKSVRAAQKTWSGSPWFELAGKATWRAAQIVHIPYLNIFSNLSHYDAYLRFLPDFDIVQERNGLYRVAVARACRRLGLPYILFFDADDIFEHNLAGEPITGVLRWRAEQIIRETQRTADHIITVSDAAKSRLVDRWGVPEGKIDVFANGVDVFEHRPFPEEREAIRAALGVGENPLIIYVGGFFPWHDLENLLKAFQQTLHECPKARLVLVGEGKQSAVIAEMAYQLGIDGSTIFTGPLPHVQVPKYVSAADVAVAPFTQLNLDCFWWSPMKVFEYMATGTALVSTSLGQICKVIQDGENGLLVEDGDITGYARAITRLVQDPALRQRLGRRAREDVERNYSWNIYITRLEKVYETVLAGRGQKKRQPDGQH